MEVPGADDEILPYVAALFGPEHNVGDTAVPTDCVVILGYLEDPEKDDHAHPSGQYWTFRIGGDSTTHPQVGQLQALSHLLLHHANDDDTEDL